MFQEVTTILLRSLDSMHSTGFGHEDVKYWAAEILDALLNAGIIHKSGYARSVTCHECAEQCSVEVEIIEGEDGYPPRAFHECPYRDDIGRVKVPLEALDTYRLSPHDFATWLSREVGAADKPENPVDIMIHDRLWRLGRIPRDGQRHDALLARGTEWADAAAVFAGASAKVRWGEVAILTFAPVPSLDCFSSFATVIPLARVLRIENNRLTVDMGEIEETLSAQVSQSTACYANSSPDNTDHRLIHCEDERELHFGNDYRILYWGDKLIKISPKQAIILKALHEAMLSGKPLVTEDILLTEADSDTSRIKNIFPKKDANERWRLIKAGKPGCYSLNAEIAKNNQY